VLFEFRVPQDLQTTHCAANLRYPQTTAFLEPAISGNYSSAFEFLALYLPREQESALSAVIIAAPTASPALSIRFQEQKLFRAKTLAPPSIAGTFQTGMKNAA